MKRTTFYILFLLVYCIARGQTGLNYRYWFDNNYDTVHEGHSASKKWRFNVDLNGLSESVHAIHVQVADDDDLDSSPVTRFFLKTRDTDMSQAYYWFDTDQSVQQLSGMVQGAFDIDVSKLKEGFHQLYYQIVGRDGATSSIVSKMFYKITIPEATVYRCWVDDDTTSVSTGNFNNSPIILDFSQICDGYHVLRTQIEHSNSSSVVSRPFIKVPHVDGYEYLKCLCWVDNELLCEENIGPDGGVINWNFDVSKLALGVHKLQLQVITPVGAATRFYETTFERVLTFYERADVNCDGLVDISDIVAVINTIAGNSFFERADVNEDETVDISDIVAVINTIASGK